MADISGSLSPSSVPVVMSVLSCVCAGTLLKGIVPIENIADVDINIRGYFELVATINMCSVPAAPTVEVNRTYLKALAYPLCSEVVAPKDSMVNQ